MPHDGQYHMGGPNRSGGNRRGAEFHGATFGNLVIERDHIPGMVQESTAWDVYNNEARKVDNELVKDWTASLNSLLLFTAIFAAVLTAFIVESKKMLEDDQTETLIDVVIFYNANLANGSFSPYSRSKFKPSAEAVSINCLLFASLGASLVAALASVIALQWVADYDAAITRGGSSPEDRAKRRQFRFAGVVRWKMAEIIAALPLLLYCSVILFWAGTIQWMWTINHVVAYVVAGGTAVAVLFYFITTLLATMFVSAPFRTPLSRGLYWTHQLFLSLVYNVLSLLPLHTMNRMASILLQPVRSGCHRFLTYLRNNTLNGWIDSSDLHSDTRGPSRRIFMRWIRIHVLPGNTSRQREDEVAQKDPRLGQQALGWLAQQLNISLNSHYRLLLLLGEVTKLSSAETLSRSFLQVSWPEILDSLGWHYMRKIIDVKVEEKDHEAIGILVRCSRVPEIAAKILPGSDYTTDPSKADYWAQSCVNLPTRNKAQHRMPQNMTFLLARDVPVPSPDSQFELETTTKLIWWRNTAGMKNNDIWSEVFMNIEPFSSRYLEACLRCFELVVICSLSKQPYEYSFRQDANRLVVFDSKSRTFMERPDLGPIFSVILRHAVLGRVFTRGEMLALLQCLEIWVTRKPTGFPEEFAPNTAVRRPLLYGELLSYMFSHHREIHYKATLCVARMVASLPKVEQPLWKRTIVMLLWLGRLKPVNYWYNLTNMYGEEAGLAELWGEMMMDWCGYAHEIPHIVEMIQIFERMPGSVEDIGPSWLFGQDTKAKRDQVVQIVESFDKILGAGSDAGLHLSLIRFICRDMGAEGQHWHRSSRISEDIHQRLSGIRDPCLLLIGAYACGFLRSAEVRFSESYLTKHSKSVDTFIALVYQRMSPNDSPENWQLCAPLWPIIERSVRNICPEALVNPMQLDYLQVIFQYPFYCQNHRSGSQHMLLHLHECLGPLAGFRQEKVLFGTVHMNTERYSPILALFALSAGQNPSALVFYERHDQKCIQRLWEICRGVKQHAELVITLLADIASQQAAQTSSPRTVAMILESIRQTMRMLEDEASPSMLKSLSVAVKALRATMLSGLPLPGTTKERRSIALEAEMIYKRLQATSTARIVLGSSQLRLLSCARTHLSACPATGWLASSVLL